MLPNITHHTPHSAACFSLFSNSSAAVVVTVYAKYDHSLPPIFGLQQPFFLFFLSFVVSFSSDCNGMVCRCPDLPRANNVWYLDTSEGSASMTDITTTTTAVPGATTSATTAVRTNSESVGAKMCSSNTSHSHPRTRPIHQPLPQKHVARCAQVSDAIAVAFKRIGSKGWMRSGGRCGGGFANFALLCRRYGYALRFAGDWRWMCLMGKRGRPVFVLVGIPF